MQPRCRSRRSSARSPKTWGDRSRDAKIGEQFLLDELLELAKEALVLQQGVVLTREPTEDVYITISTPVPSLHDQGLGARSVSLTTNPGVVPVASATWLRRSSSRQRR